MNISYAKDYRHNYLVISDEKVLSDDYQLRMMIKNQVKGLLPCVERMINGEGLLYYEVTSLQPISILYETSCIGMQQIKTLLKYILELVKELPRYMLKYPALVLRPEYIFMDIDTEECRFLYYPFYEAETDELSYLIHFMLDRVNNDDLEAVEAIYQLADIYERQHLSIIEVLSWFEREYESEDESKTNACYSKEDSSVKNTDTFECYEDDSDYIDSYEDKESWLCRLKKWLFGSKDTGAKAGIGDAEDFFEDYPVYVDSPNNSVEEGTVYIPWIENSEQKLYGIGHNNKYRIDLNKLPITVGKLEGKVDMLIRDNSISRMHVRFLRDGSKYKMQDLNSTNGCFKNGMRLTPNETVTIEPGDEIGLGKLKFIYR